MNYVLMLVVCDIAEFGIDPIPRTNRASIANTDTFDLKKQFIYFCVGESNAS